MVQRYEQTRKLQWYKRGAAYLEERLVEFLDAIHIIIYLHNPTL